MSIAASRWTAASRPTTSAASATRAPTCWSSGAASSARPTSPRRTTGWYKPFPLRVWSARSSSPSRRVASGYPKPTVGAVAVAAGEIVGEGATEEADGRHGEVIALAAAGGERPQRDALRDDGAVRLNTGTTPPRGRGARRAGIAWSSRPARSEPEAGGGLDRLRARGVEACTPTASRARRQNEAWRTWLTLGRPFATYKAAVTLTGASPYRAGAGSRRGVPAARANCAPPPTRSPSAWAPSGWRTPPRRAGGRRRDSRAGSRSVAGRSRRDGPRAAERPGRGRAARPRRRRRPVAPARGRTDARDGVPPRRPRRQAAPLRRTDLAGEGPALVAGLDAPLSSRG